MAPKSHEILQMFVWKVGGRGHKLAPSIKRPEMFANLQSYIFTHLRRITSKFGIAYQFLRPLF